MFEEDTDSQRPFQPSLPCIIVKAPPVSVMYLTKSRPPHPRHALAQWSRWRTRRLRRHSATLSGGLGDFAGTRRLCLRSEVAATPLRRGQHTPMFNTNSLASLQPLAKEQRWKKNLLNSTDTTLSLKN